MEKPSRETPSNEVTETCRILYKQELALVEWNDAAHLPMDESVFPKDMQFSCECRRREGEVWTLGIVALKVLAVNNSGQHVNRAQLWRNYASQTVLPKLVVFCSD